MTVEEAEAIIATLPICNAYRLVVLNNPNADIVKFINKYNFTDLPVVVACINAEKLSVAEIIDCSKLDKIDITKYILNFLAKRGISIEERALDYIIDATNSNMTNIVNELNKLAAYALDTNIITMEIATNLVSNSNEYAVYMLTNAIDSKDYTAYQTVINELIKNSSTNEIFSYLGKYFKRMQYLCLNKQDNQLIDILNIKPYGIKMARQHIAKNGIKYYINLYQKYIDLDYKIKSGKISSINALYELVF